LALLADNRSRRAAAIKPRTVSAPGVDCRMLAKILNLPHILRLHIRHYTPRLQKLKGGTWQASTATLACFAKDVIAMPPACGKRQESAGYRVDVAAQNGFGMVLLAQDRVKDTASFGF
jgi:hypothetical protein